MWSFSKLFENRNGAFKVKNAVGKFRSQTSANIESLPAFEAFTLLMGFYGNNRATDVLEDDGDMLLFQWGTYDWGQGEKFETNLTRQLILSGAEGKDIWQLQLTYYYPPNDKLVALGSGDRWCHHPKDVSSFSEFVLNSPPVVSSSLQPSESVKIHWEHV